MLRNAQRFIHKPLGIIEKNNLMKHIFSFIFIIIAFTSFSQEKAKEVVVYEYDTIFKKKTIKIIDTVYQQTTIVFQNDTLNETIVRSEYNDLYEKLLDQKNAHYDSSLSFLEVLFAILSLVIVIILAISAYLGYNEFKSMKSNLKTDLAEAKQDISKDLNSKANEIATLKYEKDITLIKEDIINLESFANEASEGFSVKRSKNKPKLKGITDQPRKKETNPFNRKK